MTTKKSVTKKKSPTGGRIETRGRKKAVLEHQVWFRISEEEKQELMAEAEDEGRTFSGHIRRYFIRGWKADRDTRDKPAGK